MQYNIDLAKAKGEVLVFNFIIYFKQKNLFWQLSTGHNTDVQ